MQRVPTLSPAQKIKEKPRPEFRPGRKKLLIIINIYLEIYIHTDDELTWCLPRNPEVVSNN